MTPLYGHDAAIAAFRDGLDERPPAPRLADHRAARASARPCSPTRRRCACWRRARGRRRTRRARRRPTTIRPRSWSQAGSHPDLMRLERLTKDSGTELARSISVDQVRGLQRLFATTASHVALAGGGDRRGRRSRAQRRQRPAQESRGAAAAQPLPAGQPRRRAAAADDPLALPPAAGSAPLDADAMASALRDRAARRRRATRFARWSQVGEGAPGPRLAFRGLDIDGARRGDGRRSRATATRPMPDARRWRRASRSSPRSRATRPSSPARRR